MVLIFDLDDTLYDELTYVRSGFHAVARFLEEKFGWDQDASYRFMTRILCRQGRGRVFNRLLEAHNTLRKGLVLQCLGVYRSHFPNIRLAPAARKLLPHLTGPLYLVTDGNKQVQARKVAALRIESRFRKVYITHRYGVRCAKPSTHCFKRIRDRERCAWKEMVYVGDDPSKDFVNLTPLGVRTVRVLTGRHRHEAAKPGYEAVYAIRDLSQLPGVYL